VPDIIEILTACASCVHPLSVRTFEKKKNIPPPSQMKLQIEDKLSSVSDLHVEQ
jgi:hypothetical protein